jgi:transposase InsO family protein
VGKFVGRQREIIELNEVIAQSKVHVNPHGLRRTYARRQYESRFDVVALQQNLSHVDRNHAPILRAHRQSAGCGGAAGVGVIERFNRTYREDVLDAYLFETLEEVRAITDAWIDEYNTIRPHAALDGVTPVAYAAANSP